MRSGVMRRSLAAASAAVIGGAALAVGGAGVAAAEPVSATTVVAGGLLTSQFTITRTVDEKSPTYGEVVTVTTKVNRDDFGHLLYEVRDFTPGCMEYVPGSAVANKGGDIDASAERVRWGFGLGRIADPFTLTADYRVLCDAGARSSGGTWMQRNLAESDQLGNKTMGPDITVLRKGTSILFHQPADPQVGQGVTLNVDAPDVPDGSLITFTADGQDIGSDTVERGKASVQWTPTAPGEKVIRASFAQTATHTGSAAERRVAVSQVNQDSTVSVEVAGTPTVGQSTDLTATVTPPGAGGMVEFRANGAVIGEAKVRADGTASISWIPARAELTTIDVSFSGRSGVNPSTGAAPSFVVAAPAPGDVVTTTALDAITTARTGQTVSLRATIAPVDAAGDVGFYDGQTLIGTSPVVNGVAVYEWTPGDEGARTIRAEFVPSGAFLASQATTQAVITPRPVDEQPEPEPTEPTEPAIGSLGSLTGLLGG